MKWSQEKLGDIALLCLAGTRTSPPALPDVTRLLHGLLELSHSERHSFSREVELVVEELAAAGHVVRIGSSFQLTDSGRQRCQKVFGVNFPCRQKWAQLKTRALAIAFAPGLPVATSLARMKTGSDGIRALAINGIEQAVPDAAPTLQRVLDALVWKQLGGDPTKTPSHAGMANAIIDLVLARSLGAESLSRNALVDTWIAKNVGASSPDLRSIRGAVLRTWADDGPSSNPNKEFISGVLHAARHPNTQTFGTEKAFVASVYQSFCELYPNAGVTWKEFGRRLLDGHMKGELRLTRADLVTAMDPRLVASSELTHETATYHFIDLSYALPENRS